MAAALFLCGGESKWGLRLVREPLLRGEGKALMAASHLCLERGLSALSAYIDIGLIGQPHLQQGGRRR